MASIGRAILYGFFVWLIPFGVALAIFRLRESHRPLFESIMPVLVTIVVVVFALSYLRRVRTGFLKEGVLLGVLWLLISVVIDLPLMLGHKVNMTLPEYLADVGLTYLIMPAVTVGLAIAASRRAPL